MSTLKIELEIDTLTQAFTITSRPSIPVVITDGQLAEVLRVVAANIERRVKLGPCVAKGCERTIAYGPERRADCPPGTWPHKGRNHCPRCYWRAAKRGMLADYEKLTHSRDEVLEEWDSVRGTMTRREFAASIGMSYSTFSRMWLRARAAGDTRARDFGEKVPS